MTRCTRIQYCTLYAIFLRWCDLGKNVWHGIAPAPLVICSPGLQDKWGGEWSYRIIEIPIHWGINVHIITHSFLFFPNCHMSPWSYPQWRITIFGYPIYVIPLYPVNSWWLLHPCYCWFWQTTATTATIISTIVAISHTPGWRSWWPTWLGNSILGYPFMPSPIGFWCVAIQLWLLLGLVQHPVWWLLGISKPRNVAVVVVFMLLYYVRV